jgi:hypothetical protein
VNALKGKRTYLVAALVVLTSVGTALADPQVIAAHPHGVGIAGAIIGAVMMILRSITTTPSGQSGP